MKFGCIFALTANLILFFTKLYIGLGANSISIYSDGVNNLCDCLSAVISLICINFLAKGTDASSESYISKTEDLLTFIISVIIGFTGFYFAYSSVERLMYPTTVSYRTKYLWILIATAVAKLIMFAVLKALNKKGNSDILKVMSLDCILDFFITSVTVMTLLISTYGTYAADALCGIVISIVITVSAIKTIVSTCKKMVGYVSAEERDVFFRKLYETIEESNVTDVRFIIGKNKTDAFVYTTGYKALSEKELGEISKQTGMTVYIIPRKENTEKSV